MSTQAGIHCITAGQRCVATTSNSQDSSPGDDGQVYVERETQYSNVPC